MFQVRFLTLLSVSLYCSSFEVSGEPRPVSAPQSSLVGTWSGEGLTLSLKDHGIASLHQSGVSALEGHPTTHMSSHTRLHTTKKDHINTIKGLWWEANHDHRRELCLFFDLTARCFPLEITRPEPHKLSIRIGASHYRLKRQFKRQLQREP